MTGFNIETFATECKRAMAQADDPQAAAHELLARAVKEHPAEDIKAALEAAVPPGANVGELIVHASEQLTMLYARIPGRFRSGIHNHTVFACIGQLEGEETGTLYEPDGQGGLQVTETTRCRPGEVVDLKPDAIHHIENPGEAPAAALHLYGGDFGALMDKRSLWSSGEHTEQPFSFEALVRESVRAMKQDDNQSGLQSLAKAIPAAAPLINGGN